MENRKADHHFTRSSGKGRRVRLRIGQSMMAESVYHHEMESVVNNYTWHVDGIAPFQELIVSFNAERPLQGYYEIDVAVDNSDWLSYAYWGKEKQCSFSHQIPSIQLDQDIICVSAGRSFGIRVEAKEGADLKGLYALHASISKKFRRERPVNPTSFLLPVEGLSQLCRETKYAKRICAGTSTAAALRYLINSEIEPVSFALGAYDHSFDVFGNWVFNVARANEILGRSWRSWVQRLESFDDILEQLARNIPVIVSVKGILPGSHLPYHKGHLIAVIGYDAESEEVVCMDPAYPSDRETIVRYPLEAFLEVWGARQGLAFIFQKIP